MCVIARNMNKISHFEEKVKLNLSEITRQINDRVTPESIADYLATALHTSIEKHSKEYEIKGQGGLYVHAETGQISKPSEGKGAGCQGILGAFIYAKTGKWRTSGKEFADILKQAADFAGVELPSNGNGQPAANPQKQAQKKFDLDYEHPTAVYSYTDESGNELYQNCRYEFDKHGKPLPEKDFRLRHKTSDGGWKYTISGIRRVPFHLHNLIQEPEIHDTEGEKDALTLESLGLPAVSTKALTDEEFQEFAAHCQGKEAFIYEDNDAPGREQAQARARRYWKAGCREVRIIRFTDMSEKADVTNFIQAGHGLDELYDRIQATPCFSPLEDITVNLFDEPSPRKTILNMDGRNILPEGNIAGLTAPIGKGKSRFMEILAALAIEPDCEPEWNIEIHLEKHETCILVDTERTRDDCIYALKRIWRRAGQNQALLTSDKQEFRQLKLLTLRGLDRAKRRERLLEAMETPGLKLLLIDGALDFVSNPNDIAASCDFADWLYTQATKLNIAVFYTYHGNRNDNTGKGKGWLGAELQRLSSAFLKLEPHKTTPEIRVITTDFDNGKVRNGKDTGMNIAMTWNEDLNDFRCVPCPADNKPSQEELFQWCFAKKQKDTLSRPELVETYMNLDKCSQKTAYNRIKAAVENDILSETDTGGMKLYALRSVL